MDCLYLEVLNGERKKDTHFQITKILFPLSSSYKCSQVFFFLRLAITSLGTKNIPAETIFQ